MKDPLIKYTWLPDIKPVYQFLKKYPPCPLFSALAINIYQAPESKRFFSYNLLLFPYSIWNEFVQILNLWGLGGWIICATSWCIKIAKKSCIWGFKNIIWVFKGPQVSQKKWIHRYIKLCRYYIVSVRLWSYFLNCASKLVSLLIKNQHAKRFFWLDWMTSW